MSSTREKVIYWDASAILSILFQDRHSIEAMQFASVEGIHFVSTLAYAETYAVINRIGREKLLADILIKAAGETFEKGPWRALRIVPATSVIRHLSEKWPLRGADLWHLAAARTLHQQLPELQVLTFDRRLYNAAREEKLALFINT